MKNADMLVKLYNLDSMVQADFEVRRPRKSEFLALVDWVGARYSDTWRAEVEHALKISPPTCFIATEYSKITGFCCYDTSALGFCGPIGVDVAYYGKGLGKALLLKTLIEMKQVGYGYAVIGWVRQDNFGFFQKVAGATVIEDSFPGIYTA